MIGSKDILHGESERPRLVDVFLDIETIPSKDKPKAKDIKYPKNYTNRETIKKYQENKVDEEHRKQSLVSHKGKIFCISFAIDNEEPVSVYNIDNEEQLMRDFEKLFKEKLKGNTTVKLIGFNIAKFDLKWIYQRLWKYDIKQMGYLLPLRMGQYLIDLMYAFSLADYKDMVSMDNVAKFFGIEGKGDITGKDVYPMYLDGKYEEIVKYCEADVNLTRKIYKKMV